MRTKIVIFFLLFVFIFAMADTSVMSQRPKKKRTMAVADSVVNEDAPDGDTIRTNALDDRMGVDTTSMDSLELAIYRHNKAIDDSIRLDSIHRTKSKGIDAPVKYTAKDSLVHLADR